ncbi:hypothetical protein PV08_04737 [Exophiala spinifera]|uniref:Cytochrome P450 n=1 Tax=Exophiala spinifera TaxID=91928 RepID=A0A0D2BF13_9EURO|nr:uncharacterized protein PV08_04737 [Exophiala spinifera]KIW17543.1 hypothetical protein PV08_04737 [Exophiala spinifera]
MRIQILDFVHQLGWRALPLAGILAIVVYVVYLRYFHPLSKYPGPFLASVTNFWKFYQYSTLRFPNTLIKLHEKYGPIVRIGPNDLDFNYPEAIAPIYKTGKKMPKGVFYNAFTSFVPNIFGTTDEHHHALRRRQTAHAFSVNALKSMEPIFNQNISNLISKFGACADSAAIVDLKIVFTYYAYDLTGKLAFNEDFNTQVTDDENLVPPFSDHFLLGNMYGSVANLLPWIRDWTAWHPFVKRIIQSRRQMGLQAARCVNKAIAHHKKDESVRTLLTSLIDAKDPETGATLTADEINSEAFGFLVAGSHTTGSSLTVLFYYLTHNPHVLAKMVKEIDERISDDQEVYDFAGLESQLPYTLAVIRESFRMSPVAALLLPRVVIDPQGMLINGQLIPQGTNCCMVSTVIHHNHKVWGPSHDVFDPDRFYPESPIYDPALAGYLMHFGQGYRQCIGRNIGLISIWKIVITLFKKFHFEAVDPNEPLILDHTGAADKVGPLLVRVTRR